ncbi:tyrosine-type recombinase/integrase [Miniphocaeibacter massiliensis]|uniref:tyrosine-type recombinase/integrase n=1 Tax=Miniphocaeibacter massiliensis TaxID=2041841 RepID=UPI000C1C81C2|nr:site-specific integrase [Miniphocaeibacter massiliensis]
MSRNRIKSNGEGSIRCEIRNDKKYFIARVTVGYDNNGKQIRKTFGSFKKKDVVDKMTALQHQVNQNLYIEDNQAKLKDWYFNWLFEYKQNKLKPNSFKKYEGYYRNYIADSTIGNKKLAELRTIDFQKYFNILLEDNSIGLVTNIKQTISTSLNDAVAMGVINNNYCRYAKLPSAIKRDKFTVFTKEEQTKFIKELAREEYELPLSFALATGLRLGELLALTWDDINLFNSTVTVNKNLSKAYVINKDGTRTLKTMILEPKTQSSYRTIPFPSLFNSKLKKWQTKQKEYRLYLGEVYQNKNIVFPNNIGNYMDNKKLPRAFKKVLEKANIRDMNFHSLRHSYATRLFEANVPMKTVQSLLGHKDIQTTMNIYTHVMNEDKTDAVESIAHLFG